MRRRRAVPAALRPRTRSFPNRGKGGLGRMSNSWRVPPFPVLQSIGETRDIIALSRRVGYVAAERFLPGQPEDPDRMGQSVAMSCPTLRALQLSADPSRSRGTDEAGSPVVVGAPPEPPNLSAA